MCTYDNSILYAKGGFNDWRENGGKCVDGKMDHNKLIDFEEVRDGIDNDSLVMIDVRNRHELVKSGPNGGRIPGTKNVPCKLLCRSGHLNPQYESRIFVTNCLFIYFFSIITR